MPTDMKLQLQGAGLDPTSIERVEAQQTEVKIVIDDFQIRQIQGNAEIKSKLVDGRLIFKFSPHFDWGVDSSFREETKDPAEMFEKLGLTKEQAKKVVQAINDDLELDGDAARAGGPVLVNNGTQDESDDEPRKGREIEQGRVDTSSRDVSIPLPDVSLPDIKPSFEVNNLKIDDIKLEQKTDLSSTNIDLSGLKLDDFEVRLPSPDPVSLDRAEAVNYRMAPISVPSLGFNNLKSVIKIPRLGSSEIPLNIESKSGSADLKLPIITWKPRWRWTITFRILWKKVVVWVEFGVNLEIIITYRWVVSLLRVSLKIKDAFLNNVSVAVSVGRLVFTNLKIGLVKFARLLYAKA